MRKSIKRIVSSVLAASMVLTSCVVTHFSVAMAEDFNYAPEANVNVEAGVKVVDNDSVTIETAQKMDYKTLSGTDTVNGKEYTSYAQSTSVNTSLTTDQVPEAKSYRLAYKITAKADTTVNVDHKVSSGKANYILKDVDITGVATDGKTPSGTATVVDSLVNSGSSSAYDTFTVELKAGETVWVAGQGSNICVYAIYTDGASTPGEDPGEEVTETTTETPVETTTEAPVETTTEAAVSEGFNYTPEANVNVEAGVKVVDNGSVTIETAQKMDYKTLNGTDTVNGKEYTSYAQSTSVNTSLTTDQVPEAKSYRLAYKITAKADTTVNVDHKVSSGKANYILKDVDITGVATDGTTPSGTATVVDSLVNSGSSSAYDTFTVELKAGETVWVAGQGSNICVYAIYSEGSSAPGEDVTETTTVETTEVTTVTVETTTETTTAEDIETTTEEVIAPAEGTVTITPKYVVNDDGTVTVNYKADLNNAGFNNYTMFITFDPAVLTPVSAKDGDITLAAKDALDNDITVPASNAGNITAQFNNVPAAGDTDFEGAGGDKTQAELGKVKVAYCVFDKDFSQAATGDLPEFTTSGTLFTVTYKINDGAELDPAALSAKVQVLDTVSNDLTVLGTADVVVNEATVDSGSDTSTETTTNSDTPVEPTSEATTEEGSEGTTDEEVTESTTEFTTEEVTEFAIEGNIVNATAGGTATLTFTINENPGVANYLVFVTYDPTALRATGGTVPNFTYDTDVVNKQVAYKPYADDPDYKDLGATGEKTAAELGKIKIAGINNTNVIDEDAIAFTMNFDVLATATAGTYPVNVEVVAVGNDSAEIIECGAYPGYILIKGGETPTDDTTETSSESTTDESTESTTGESTEATTDESTEATTSQVTTDASTETTTRRPSSGGGGGGGGGSVHNYTTTTTEATTEATTDEAPEVEIEGTGSTIKPPTEKDPNFTGFTDLGNYPWAEDSINKLAELGIISGIGDGQYGPALPCRRADFAILINRTLGVSVTSMTKNFYDNEDQSKYYYNDVRVGYNAGILSGYGDNNYKPEQYCTREEMAVLVAKSFEWLGNDVTSTDLSVNNKYTDVDNISWWSAPYVAYLTDMGVLNGNTDGTLLPKNYINRAEMAVMMAKVYDYALDLYQSMTTTTTEATTEETTEETTVDESSTETTTEAATETTTVVDEDL